MITTVKEYDDLIEKSLKPTNNTLNKLMELARQRNGGGNAGVPRAEDTLGVGNSLGSPTGLPGRTPVPDRRV